MKLRMQVGLGPSDTVLDGDLAPPPQRGTFPQFSIHICCGQMAEWIKMPLARAVGLGPSDIVLNGTELPPKRGTSPTFRSMSIVAKRSPISATAELLLNPGAQSLKRVTL